MTTDTDVKKWYVVRAVSGQENKIKSYIESDIARLGLSDFVEEVLVGRIKSCTPTGVSMVLGDNTQKNMQLSHMR